MLTKQQRFHGHSSVRQAYRQGTSVRGTLCSLHVVRGGRVKSIKVAVVVSKKVHRSAVVRNRIRRRIYELVRVRLTSVTEPVELIFTVYTAEAAVISSDELNKHIASVLQRAKV